ncbi:endonuclease MutS2 [Clostridium sp. CM028]|uniref:endonuclease MutS2 n=1 Tax=unclassified Clostridium TaxID=2614128 RepID=UPI001C0D25EC|nr:MULTISPECIES: endonuclease MutS2 [unclassified Clostridium]MBU3092797.1 endonuclease MutS2 [Clostridium sp. CF011]MBW9146107.1 endonuclease MutS2 [Clostridium sp. CM027]MBW9148236.1 endonuclease MutS2 [Clostridium sp. CM028]UVE41716.1 endonuclease MutS2 [Clostridium sp. CM027]WAG70719.1 endonuclease MutS2 [Clostridium sp. CF011]
MNTKSLKVLEYYKIKEKIKAYTHTTAGKDLIEGLEPYTNIYEVKEHLQETNEALLLLSKKGSAPFEGIYDVRSAIIRASKAASLMPTQLLRIAQMLRCARLFQNYVGNKSDEQSSRVLEDICIGIVPIKKLEDEIFIAIISDEEISDRASSLLFSLRKSLKEKNASVKDKVTSLVRSNAKYLQESLYTIRGDRYVIPVKIEHKGSVPGIVHDQSSSGATLFIEPMSLVNLNNEIKEIMLKEKAEVERILAELSYKIYENINIVGNNANIVWELDFIFAKAGYAIEINAIIPGVNEEGVIDIIEARHPLIDPLVVVPSNIYLGGEFTSLVITGPNTGGKTVTLKTVGLIQLMAMSGILIPAREGSMVSFFHEIFADIGDEQSIEQSLSTFSSHMANIVNIIEKADIKSLALFDELGAGTDPTEGAALAVSILENLRARGTKVVATTHYSELKGYALKTTGVENASVEFNVDTLSPTYRLIIGVPGKSNAFEISKRLGLPDYIIKNAKENISKDTLEFEELVQSLQEKSIKAERDAREAEALKLEASKLKDKYQEKLYKLENIRENAMYEAQREAKRLIKDAKEESDVILKNMRQLEKLGYSSEARQKLEEERMKIKNKLETLDRHVEKSNDELGEKLKNVKQGQEVYLPSLNQKVIVISKPDKKGEVQVQAGIMKINVKVGDLRESKLTQEDKKKAKIIKREMKLNIRNVSTSVDLRGMDSEEALYTVDKYLDEACLGGLKEATIIHGKGTGVLRKAITDMLKRHGHVKTYRLGNYGEGGSGVTVVELK